MDNVDALSRLAGGLSVSLTLLAAMLLLTYARRLENAPVGLLIERARLLNANAWTLIAFSVLVYRPLHTGWLLGHPAPAVLSRLGETIAVALANAAMIKVLAARGLLVGLSVKRVARGVLVNLTVVVLIAVAAWLTR